MPSLVPEQELPCLSSFDALPPSQLMALLRLHAPKDELARAVLAKLQASTIRDDADDRAALIAAGFACVTRAGSIRLTYLGLCKVVPLTGALARILKVTLPKFQQPSSRGGFGPGFSQAGNA